MSALYAEGWEELDAVSYILAMSKPSYPRPAHARTLGVTVADARDGQVALRWDVPDGMLNPAGIVYGGFVGAVLDMAAGLSAGSTFNRFLHQLTIELRVDFIAPVPAVDGLRAEGQIIRRGHRTLLADSELRLHGKLLARASATFTPNWATVSAEVRALLTNKGGPDSATDVPR